jgi:hypothetical protein
MTMTHSHESRRRLDTPSALLLVVGIIFGTVAYWLITEHGLNPLFLIPSVVAATMGITHLTKREAPRK